MNVWGLVIYYTSVIFNVFGNIPTTEGLETINSPKCGLSRPLSKIVHGHEASKEDVPWIVHLTLSFRNLKPIACGGSLISPSFILTAGHCVYWGKPRRLVNRVYVKYNSTRVDRGPRALVSAIRVHPVFKSNKKGKYGFDIAILKLASPVQFDSFVRPVCLPVYPMNVLGIPLHIAGWGVSEGGHLSISLRSAMTRAMEYLDCDQILNFRRIGLNDSIIICSHPEGGNICFGDSGGPLTTMGEEGRFVLLGISIGGRSCTSPEAFSVYTRVSAFVPWIKKEMRSLEKMLPTADPR